MTSSVFELAAELQAGECGQRCRRCRAYLTRESDSDVWEMTCVECAAMCVPPDMPVRPFAMAKSGGDFDSAWVFFKRGTCIFSDCRVLGWLNKFSVCLKCSNSPEDAVLVDLDAPKDETFE